MIESHLRSVTKAVSYRILGTLGTMIISYIVTQQVNVAIYIGLFEFVSKILIFYCHERVWHFIPFGLKKPIPIQETNVY